MQKNIRLSLHQGQSSQLVQKTLQNSLNGGLILEWVTFGTILAKNGCM